MIRGVLLPLPGTALLTVLFAAAPPPATAGPPDPTATLGKDKARVFADAPGGTVKASPKGSAKAKAIELRDGDVVDFVGDDAGVGAGGEIASAEVVVRGKHLEVPNEHVITEDRLQRQGPWAVFSATSGCGDVCHGPGWLLGPGGVRVRLGEDVGPNVNAVWRADGKEVAVAGEDSGVLALVALPAARLTLLQGYEAPIYARDWRLFVRGDVARDQDTVYEVLPDHSLRWVVGCPGVTPPLEEGEYSRSIAPLHFTADGTLTAEFARGHGADCTERLKPAEIGTRPSDQRAAATMRAAGTVLDDATDASRAAALARAQAADKDPPWKRELASAANTRGHRLYEAGKLADALPLFIAAAEIDRSYGMPRYNAARIFALRGEVSAAVQWLDELRAMGRSQRARLTEARKDESFKKIWAAPEFIALFK